MNKFAYRPLSEKEFKKRKETVWMHHINCSKLTSKIYGISTTKTELRKLTPQLKCDHCHKPAHLSESQYAAVQLEDWQEAMFLEK